MNNVSSPFDKLFYSPTETARKTAEFILDYIRIDPDELTVLFLVDTLPIRCRILLYLLAMHVLCQIRKRPTNYVRPRDIERGIHASGNTVRPLLMDLVSKDLIKWDAGSYCIVTAKMPDIKRYIEVAKYRKK